MVGSFRALGVLVLAGATVVGCQDSSSSIALGPQAATSASAVSSASAPQPPLPPPPPLMGPAFRLQVAGAFAPQLRFNAYQPGHPSAQNRNEDLFPMGVASFLRELHSGRPRVLVQGSSGGAPGISEERAATGTAVFDADRLAPYPREMVGDPPGQAPLYVNVYEDLAARQLGARGQGEIVVSVEYWIFYPQDRADVQILGVSTQPLQDPFGHQGDWEAVGARLRLTLGDDSRLLGGRVEEGYYASHGDTYVARRPELELVDDLGLADPDGAHIVAYVSQGKHGSFPQAGERRELPVPSWLADFVDIFAGNGVRVDAWVGDLFDLEDVAGASQEFASAEFQALLAGSMAPPAISDWTQYQGRWGPTRSQITIAGHTISLASSPTGPKAKSDYGDLGGSAIPWADTKIQQSGILTVYRDIGTSPAIASPPPLPVRR
jgi:hypothetical protein